MKISIIIFLTFFTYLSHAQSYDFKNYKVDDGLSSNMITCIMQDASGFMWFGTRNGLNRFDGTNFKIYKHDIKDSTSIGNNYISSIFEDNNKKLWIGTSNGLYTYDAVYDKFSLYSKYPLSGVNTISSDKENNLWFISGNTLFKLNNLSNEITKYQLAKKKKPTISITSNGTIWVGTDSGILKRYNRSNKSFSNVIVFPKGKNKKDPEIKAIYPINDTSLLIGFLDQLLLFNTRTLESKSVLNKNVLQSSIITQNIISNTELTYWIGTSNGIYSINLKTGKIDEIKKINENFNSLTNNNIRAFCKDKEGNIWVGTYLGGINIYSEQINKFQKSFSIVGKNSISGNIVHEIVSDKNQNLWIGTEDGGLNKIDKKSGAIKHFTFNNSKGNFIDYSIQGLLADGNELWVSTSFSGIYVLDINTDRIIRHYEISDKPDAINDNFTIAIYKTRKGKILFGTSIGLYEYDKIKNNFKKYPFFKGLCNSILEDENGTIWTSSNGSGISFQNTATRLEGSLKYDSKDTNSLPNNNVNNIFEDSKRNIWVCTESGLFKIEFKSKIVIRFSNVYPINNCQIFRVLEDKRGKLWVTTSKGLVNMNSDGTEIKLYDKSNGLLSEQFYYNSAHKSKEGILYFGTTKGMIFINPATLIENNYIPPVFITGLQINNQGMTVNNSSYLSKAVPYTSDITLPYDSSNITLEVAALSYTIPNKNEFSYKMEGFDKDWTFIKTNRKIYYTQLPPGDYIFKVKGTNSDGIWNEKETVLNIKILSPFWATNWAYLLYTIIILGVVFTILNYSYRAIKDKNLIIIKEIEIEKERAIHTAKIDFITNITHEIRTPLTLIKLPLDKLFNSLSSNPILKENLNMINKNTNRLIDLTNQILDFRKVEAHNYNLSIIKTDINNILEELFIEYKPIAENKKINYTLKMPRLSLFADVDPEAFRKIISNLINNALKYSKEFVSVRLYPYSSEDDHFKIEFSNDGLIIPNDLKEKIFEPFYRIKQTENVTGTGIGLTLCRSLAELHNGILEIKIREDKLNTFILTLPILKENKQN